MRFPTARLEDVLETLIDYRGKTPTKTSAGVRLITAKVIKDGFINDSSFEYVAEDDYESWMRRGLPKVGDLLVTTEAPLGEVARIVDERVALAQRVILLRADRRRMNPRFLFHAFKSPFVQAELRKRATGTTVLGVKQSELREIQVPLPSISVQQHISDVLSPYDDLIENNTKRIKILEEMARSLYREWFVEFRFPSHKNTRIIESDGDNVPTGWTTTTIGALASLINRGVAPTYHDDGPELVINQKCIRDQRLSLEPARRHRTKVPPEKYVRQFDVLLNSTGMGTLGRVAQVMTELERCTVDTHVTVVRPGVNIHPHFFGHALLAKEAYFEAQGTGATGQTELARGRIGETPLIVPPREFQARFDEVVAPWRGAADILLKKQYTLRATRDLLLPRLISGEIELDP